MSKSIYGGIVAALASATMAVAGPIGFSEAVYQIDPLGLVAPSSIVVDVVTTGGEQVAGVNFYAQIGDGGDAVGGTNTAPPAPRFTGDGADFVNAPGGVFAGQNQGPTTVADLAVVRGASTLSGTRAADGILAQLTIDGSAAVAGTSWMLSLINPVAGLETQLLDAQASPIPVELGTAMIEIIPEPASALLLIGALPFLRRRIA